MRLEVDNVEATNTKIMYKAYLSYWEIKEYLSVLKGINQIDT